MFRSWKVGTVSGIDVYLHPTLLLLLWLPQVSGGGALGLALVTSVFGCVLLHEFGHALMARRFGIETQDITLYPIGGVARLSRMPKSPGAELLIALAGPAVNLAIVCGLLGLAILGGTETLGFTSWLGSYFVSLMYANLVLALFNLIPAFPMDGGRVLRALLSNWLGRVKATAVAAGTGQVLAILFGVFSLFNGMLFQVFLAAFIFMAARMELAGVVAEERNRRYEGDSGIWTAPTGYRWVQRGNGIWQLAPIVVTPHERKRTTWM